MTEFPDQGFAPLYFSCLSGLAAPADLNGKINTVAQGTWVANLAVYIPFYLPVPYPVRRVFWVNGSSAGAANIDFGVFHFSGEQVFSIGSTAKSGTSNVQFVTLGTAVYLVPGRYYMAYANSTSTASIVQVAGSVTASQLQYGGVLQEASAFTLPASMTPAVPSNALYPLCGFTQTT